MTAGPGATHAKSVPDAMEAGEGPGDKAYEQTPERPESNEKPVDDFLDSEWFPLNWPAMGFESAARPVIWTVEFIDRYRIHRRVYDLLTNDERTAAIYPFASFGNEGLNRVGIRAFHRNLFNERKVARISMDWDMDRSVTQRFRYTDPSVLGSSFYAGMDQKFGRYMDTRYYGLGNQSLKANRYSFRSDYESVTIQSGYGQGRNLGVGIALSVDHSEIRPSVPATPGTTAGVTPEQLGVIHDKTLLGVAGVARFDRRRWRAETLEGYRLLATLGMFASPGGNPSRFLKWSVDAAWFQPLIHRGRVLVLRAWIESVHPLSGGEVGLFDLPAAGGDNFLRGFPTGRFRDRTAMVFSQEYRFPVWRFMDFTVFADEGRVMSGPGSISFADMHLSWGASIRSRRRDLFLWRFVFAQSKEGIRLNLSFNQEF
ncbi:MAG: BamA/TamA family outer membrane protein [Deltaproteobacteria bacterium]|nr:BamA/TamA family outer membrane protein [Deltaproteobacteria bacterium]